MSIQLTVMSLDFDSKTTPFTKVYDKDELTIGRLPNNDLVLDRPEVSAYHAKIRVEVREEDGTLILLVKDLGSSNGTMVENKSLRAQVEIEVQANQRVIIGNYLIKPQAIASAAKSSVANLFADADADEEQAQEQGSSFGLQDSRNRQVVGGWSYPEYSTDFDSGDSEAIDTLEVRTDFSSTPDFDPNSVLAKENAFSFGSGSELLRGMSTEDVINPFLATPEIAEPELDKDLQDKDFADAEHAGEVNSEKAGALLAVDIQPGPVFDSVESSVPPLSADSEPATAVRAEPRKTSAKSSPERRQEPEHDQEPERHETAASGTPAVVEVHVTDDNVLDIDFSAVELFSVSGQIMHRGKPLSAVTVTAAGIGSSITDAQGRYQFKNIPESTSIELSAERAGYVFDCAEPTFVVRSEQSVEMAAVQVFTLTGAVRHRGGPLAGVTVDGGSLGRRTTGADGNFSFGEIREGTGYSLQLRKERFQFTPQTISGTVQDGNVNTTVTSTQLFTVSGRVTHHGKALAGVVVDGGEHLGKTVTDSEGRYVFENVPENTKYKLTAQKDKFSFAAVR